MNYADFTKRWKFDPSLFGACLKAYEKGACQHIRIGCYLIVDKVGSLSYIGMSLSGVVRRVESHIEKKWFHAAYIIEDDLAGSTARAHRLERSLIRLFTPYANRERYIGLSDLHQDIWVVRTYGIQHPLDFLLGDIKEPTWHADDRLMSVGYMKCTKPGDLCQRLIELHGDGQ